MNVVNKYKEIKINNKLGLEYNNKKSEYLKNSQPVNSKDKELEIKKLKRKKLSATNNNFKLNKNSNNHIIFRHNTFNKLKEKDIIKDKKENIQIRKDQKTMILDQDLSKEINPLNFLYLNNTNKNKNNSNQKNIPKLNKGSTSRKESKKIAKNLSRENIKGGGNNFLQGGTQRKKILINDIENNNKILRLYDLNILNKDDYTLINNINEITFTTNHKNQNRKEKKHSSNNLIINSGNKYKGDKKVSLVDKFTNNYEYYKHHNQIKIDTNNINNINNSINNINNNITKKNSSIPFKARSNDKIIKNYKNISGNKSKENIVKNIKNLIIENNNKNNIDLINKCNTNNTNNNIKNSKEVIAINQSSKNINTNDCHTNKTKQNLTISSGQTKLDAKSNNMKFELYNLNNKKFLKSKNKEKIINSINKNINILINKNDKTINTLNSNNIYLTYINNTSSSNVDFQKIKNHLNYNSNINKSNTNIKEKLKNSSKKSINSISITKLNTLQNEDIKKRIKCNNFKSKINFSSPKMPSLYERHNDKPHLRRPLSNNQNYKNNDKTYSPKINYIPKYMQTENNVRNNNIFMNRLEYLGNYSISSRKENIFSKINNNFKNNNNYINILNKRKLSAKIKDDRGNSLLKLIENKDKIKEKESINLTKRRPRKFENEVNNLFTEISNIYNNNKNSFFNFGFKKNNNNSIKNSRILDNFQNNNNEKNRKYSFINILKPKAISQQKRYSNINEEKEINHENSKNKRDTKSLTFISKEKNEKKKNISLLRKKRIIKLIHMMDEFNSSKSKSKSKRKNKSYNNSKKRGASAIKERKNINKFQINFLGEKDKIIDNVIKNEIISYTINIISKYNDNCKKIGLSKIKLYDKNNNEIFIVNSYSNIRNNEEENVNNLFNIKNYYYNNRPYIADFKENLYIKFYVIFKKSNIINYLKIINYENNEDRVSPVKEIKIYHGKKLLFQGTLKVNYFNIINISENQNNFDNKEFPFFTAKKTKGSSTNITNSSISNIYNSNYKRNNTRSYSTFRASSGKKNNKIPKKQLIKINSVRNISKKNYVYKNIDNYQLINYNNTEIEENYNFNNKIIDGSICNTIAYNNNNDFEKKNVYMRERFISDNNISRENNINVINENDVHKGININKFNLNNYKIKDTNFSLEEEEINNINSPLIKFKRIRLVLSSNYGNPNFIGLTGLEFYDKNNKLIDIETAQTIGAMPKDLYTIYNNENDYRIFENIFNGENNVNDPYNMWVTLFTTPNKEFPYIELSFNNYIYLSKINIFNYNKKNELDKCAKTIEIFLDNKYYNTIHLIQGIGEIINENIIQKENSNNNNSLSNNKNNKTYCQEILFPIKNDYYDKKKAINNSFLPIEEIKVDYASQKYEQSYETPYIPNGQIIKFQLINNYYKGKNIDNHFINSNTNSVNNIHIKNYNYIGINILNIFDENGNDLLSQKDIKYKIISNKEMIISEEHQIILNCPQNEDINNNIYFLFEYPVNISYIQIDPFSLIKNDKNFLNSAKEIKIFCDTSILFEGELYNSHQTIILFTSNEKILKNINVNYLTKKKVNREAIEIKNESCFSLSFKD